MTNFNRLVYTKYYDTQPLIAEAFQVLQQQLDDVSVSVQQLTQAIEVKADEVHGQYGPKAIEAIEAFGGFVMWAANAAYMFGIWYRQELQAHTETWMEASYTNACFFDSLEEEAEEVEEATAVDNGWTLEEDVIQPATILIIAAYRAANRVMRPRVDAWAQEVANFNEYLNVTVDTFIGNTVAKATNCMTELRCYILENIPFNLGDTDVA